MERSRRRVLVDLAVAFGAMVARTSVVGRLGLAKKERAAAADRAFSGTSTARAPRVYPAPFTVKRNG